MRHARLVLLVCCLLAACARDAAADVTAFIGVTPSPRNHAVRGAALGFGFLIIGFELEYANAVEDALEGLPGLQTGSGNLMVQTPVEIAKTTFYGTTGGGIYRERLLTQQETAIATNVGGGAKIRLTGPLRVRIDYRIFRLQGEPINKTYHRLYFGANLSF